MSAAQNFANQADMTLAITKYGAKFKHIFDDQAQVLQGTDLAVGINTLKKPGS